MSAFYSDEVLSLIDELGLVPCVLLTPSMVSVFDAELRARRASLCGIEKEVSDDFLSLYVQRYNRRGRKLDYSFYPQFSLEFSEK